LLIPAIVDASAFSMQFARALDAGDVAAVLLRLAETDERTLINRIKSLAPPVQDKGIALLVDGHPSLVARGGADGAHLTGVTEFTEALEILKPERITGAGGLMSRHDAMVVAEQGADYVMFGEPDATGKCPALTALEERISWWAEVFEIPCVGYAASMETISPLVAAGADFIALGDALWTDPDTLAHMIREAGRHLRLPEPTA
jgi:thiamine-phosphate pyrophosphorylase